MLRNLTLAALAAIPASAGAAALVLEHPWWTPDQQGTRLYRRGDWAGAVRCFRDPAWRAAALFQDGRFDDAAALLAGLPGPEAAYNRGNALVMRGLYEDAVESYERALSMRPDWAEAIENRDIAASRVRTETALGEATEVGADDIVFDPDAGRSPGDPVEVDGGEELAQDDLRALWLRGVRSEPADFLRVKFAYQKAVDERTTEERR